MENLEWIKSGDQTIAIIIRANFMPDVTTFITPNDLAMQTGFVVYPRGQSIVPHLHKPIERHITGTLEALLVRRGRVEVDLYNSDKQSVTRRTLETGDVILLVSGGHGFSMQADTVLFEIKQGPYTGVSEKERF